MKKGIFTLSHNEPYSFTIPRGHHTLFIGSLYVGDVPINECTIILKSVTGGPDERIEYKRVVLWVNQCILYNDCSPRYKFFKVESGTQCNVTLLLNDADAKLYGDIQFGLHWR